MEKKLYWLLEDNGDLSTTCSRLDDCKDIIQTDFADLEKDDQKETIYTITPVWYTDKEYSNLPEA